MTISFARHQFPPAIIRHAVWLYLRFSLSYRDVEDLLVERGVDVSYETVRRALSRLACRHSPAALAVNDEQDQLPRLSVSARDYPTCDLAVCSVHVELPGYRG